MILPEHVLQRRIFTEKSYKKVTNGTLTALENMGLLNTQEETIDVGAAAGIMSTFFAKKTKHVHSYEPSPSFVQTEKLKEKFDNVTTYNLAVSNFKGKETFLSLYGVENSKKYAKELVEESIELISEFEKKSDTLIQICKMILLRSK